MTRGLRTRAAEIVSLDLGRHTQHEITASVGREIEQERFTSMDRALMRFSRTHSHITISVIMSGGRAGIQFMV